MRPSWLDRYRRLRIVVRRAVASLQTGAHRSIFKGAGLAFEEVRHYQPGDEVRSIDWNVTARLGQPFVKRFVEERELRILFLLDISGSQQTGSGLCLKRDVAAEALALLALGGLSYGDSQGLALFTDRMERYLPPRRGLRHTLELIHLALFREPLRPGTDLSKALQFARKVLRRRSVVVILSDFLDQDWHVPFNQLCHRHEVIAIRTRDPLDDPVQRRSPCLVALEDAETGKRLLISRARAGPQASEPVSPASSLPEQAGVRDALAARRSGRGPATWIDLSTDGHHLENLLTALERYRRQRLAKH